MLEVQYLNNSVCEFWKMFFLPWLFAKKAALTGDLVTPLVTPTRESSLSFGPDHRPLAPLGLRLQPRSRCLLVARKPVPHLPVSWSLSLLPVNPNTDRVCHCWSVQGIGIGRSRGLIKTNTGKVTVVHRTLISKYSEESPQPCESVDGGKNASVLVPSKISLSESTGVRTHQLAAN